MLVLQDDAKSQEVQVITPKDKTNESQELGGGDRTRQINALVDEFRVCEEGNQGCGIQLPRKPLDFPRPRGNKPSAEAPSQRGPETRRHACTDEVGGAQEMSRNEVTLLPDTQRKVPGVGREELGGYAGGTRPLLATHTTCPRWGAWEINTQVSCFSGSEGVLLRWQHHCRGGTTGGIRAEDNDWDSSAEEADVRAFGDKGVSSPSETSNLAF